MYFLKKKHNKCKIVFYSSILFLPLYGQILEKIETIYLSQIFLLKLLEKNVIVVSRNARNLNYNSMTLID